MLTMPLPSETLGFHVGIILSCAVALPAVDWAKANIFRVPSSPLSGTRSQFRLASHILHRSGLKLYQLDYPTYL